MDTIDLRTLHKRKVIALFGCILILSIFCLFRKEGLVEQYGVKPSITSFFKAPKIPDSAKITGVQPSFFTANKTILFYNNYFYFRDYNFGLGVKPFQDKCGRSDCSTTHNTSLFQHADAVLWYGWFMRWKTLPKRNHTNQLFVYFETEPAPRSSVRSFGLETNITITYRRDSMIPWILDDFQLRDEVDDGATPILTREQLDTKTTLVAWMVSNVNSPFSHRTLYARLLAEHVSMHIYGPKQNYTCDKREMTGCMKMIERGYKFYLSFENSNCRDYITEKIWRTLRYNVVPIVMGGVDYAECLPPHSYIDTRDFASPRHLAEYLHHLDRHPREYLRYFEWKRQYELISHKRHPFCVLCDKLHDPDTKYYQNFDVGDWWSNGVCIGKQKSIDVFHIYDNSSNVDG